MTQLAFQPANRIGFGAMQLPGPGVLGPPRDRDAAIAVLRRALELGVDHVDTASYYGPDVANELIRDALAPYPADLKIVSKVGARRGPAGEWLPAVRPEEIRAQVEADLRVLGVEALALVNLRLGGAGGVADVDVPLEEGLGTLADLRDAGKLEHVGVSNVPAPVVARALALTEIAAVQNHFNVLERDARPELELCREHGLAFVPFFPLGSAFTGGPARLGDHEAVAAVAARHGATPSQVALAWLLGEGEHVLLIPGTASVAHLEENMAAAELRLDDEDRARLDAAAPEPGGV